MGNPVIHIDHTPGLVMSTDITWEERTNVDGEPYWRVECPIGSLFGSSVEGVCEGIGRTKEEALERLKQDQHNLYESLWA